MHNRYLIVVIISFAAWFITIKSEAQIRTLQKDSTSTGNLSPAGKVDTFRIVADDDGQVHLTLTVTNGQYTWVTLYDKDTVTVLANNYTNGTFTLSRDGLAAGTYFIRVYAYFGGQTPEYNLKYTLNPASVANDTEPNNSKAQAQTLELNSTITGHVGYYYDKKRDTADWYKLITNADGRLQFKLTTHNTSPLFVYLFDNNGTSQLLGEYTHGTFTVNKDGLAAGTYYVRINCYYSENFTPYTLTDSLFSPAQANDIEPNSNKAQALILNPNSTVTGHVGYFYDNKRDTSDWYKLTLPADGRLQFRLTSHNTSPLFVYLFDNNGTSQLLGEYTHGTFTVNKDGLAAGTYYVRINCYYSENFTSYTLTDSLFSPSQSNDIEPNSNKAQALILNPNSTVTGHVGYFYDNRRDTSDWYKITLPADGMLQFKLTSHNTSPLFVYLFDNNGTTQLLGEYTHGTFTVNKDGLAAGTYYVRINCYYSENFTSYTLTDSLFTYNPNDPEPNNAPSQATTIPGNSTATGHVNFYYNGARDPHDWWKINYTDSTGKLKIKFDLLPNKLDNNNRHVWFQLYRDTSAAPIYNNYFINSSNELNFTSLQQGVYYIKIFTYYGDNFSAYAITPLFTSAYVTATISLLSATQGTGCNENILSYKLGGSTSPYIPYTVKLYRNNILYDSAVVDKDTVTFKLLPEGSYYATVLGFNAPAGVTATSATSQFNAVNPPPIPTTTPVITKSGRMLHSSPRGARETYQWYRDGVLITGATDSNYYAALRGSYTVRFANACGVGPVSNTISFTGDYQDQTINFSPITDRTYGDSIVVLNATSSSGLPVEFIIISGKATIIGNQLHIKGAGQITVEARQQGDDNYGIASPVRQTFNVLKAPQAITFADIADKDYRSAPFTLSATANSGLPVVYSVVSGNAYVSGNTVTLTGIGTVTIRASQPGDSNYLAASAVERSFCVTLSKLNPMTGPASICPGKPATYTAENIAGATYTWRIAGGSTLASTTNTVTVTWPSQGTYTLIVNAAGNCGASSKNDSLIVTAVPSVQPDSVHTMLPVNNAVNQQLPLTLSWIPANPQLYYTYDIYLWKADQAQPSTPYVANLTTVNHTIAFNSGLAYNTTYKWMVVAHNGSCTDINTGPVQQFTLIPLPDLQVYDVNAPTSAFSGQRISVSWKVKNNGPGNTQLNQRWTDAIYISKDSLMDFGDDPFRVLVFPIVPKLVATKQNVTALNAGESYSDTANFILPVDYSGPLYIHVVTNYSPPATNAVIETTLANDTAHALPAIAVALSPQPDLMIDSIVNPGNTFSGSTINFTYKVRNRGGANASGSWNDKIYISKDPLFNINNAVLLKRPNHFTDGSGHYEVYYPAVDAINGFKGILQQDSSYTYNIPVVVPNFIYGSYYIYVVIDADKHLYEGPNESNNVDHGNLLQVFLTPTPKLVPVNVTVPANASSTQTLSISWKDKNLGAYDNIEKNRGHYFVQNGTCRIPCGVDASGGVIFCPDVTGTSYRDSIGFGSSYWLDKVYLSTDSTGLNLANATFIGEAAQGQSRPIRDEVLPTVCVGFRGAAMPNNINTGTALSPNQEYLSAFNYKVPDNMAQGTYYIYIVANANKTVYEYPGTTQIARSNAFTVAWPDLTVPSATAPSTGNSGQPITVAYSILNTGQGGVHDHHRKDYIYLGNNSTFDGTAIIIDSVIYNAASVPVNAEQQLSKQVNLPNGVSGSKYIFVRVNVDSSFKEITLSNNINSAGAPINITLSPSPDFIVSSIDVAGTVYSSAGFPFKYTVSNTGAGTASGRWKDSIFISCNSTYSTAESYFVGIRQQQNFIPAGGSYTDSFNLVLPQTYRIRNTGCLNNDTAQVYFFVRTNSDNGFYEDNTSNNVSGSAQKSVINVIVDHIVTNVSSSNDAAAGRSFKVYWTVKNIGWNPNDDTYRGWTDVLFLSRDSVLSSSAYHLFSKTKFQLLNHDQSYTDSAIFQLPSMPPGQYYLITTTNYGNTIPAERNLANNINLKRDGSGQPIRINITNPPASDLTNVIVSAPTKTAVGQPIKIVYTVTNNGVGASFTTWTDDVWLSNSFQPGGLFFNRKHRNTVLLPGQSYTDSVTVNIPINQPQGNYTIVVFTNQDRTEYESNYANNTSYKYISVYVPAPVDLIVTDINIADTVTLGDPATVTWNIFNNSNNPANGSETDGIYLGKDSETSSNDVLIGTKLNRLDLLPLNSIADTAQPVISGVPEGNYFVKVRTDILNNIIESNKQNNTTVRDKKIYVTVKLLPINVITADMLRANYLFYKLIVPAELKGKTIAVKLTSSDSLTANNQMYIGLGYLPSASRFDYGFDRPNYGNQQIIIESVTDSVYYIAAKGTKPGGSFQTITLQATVLPFSILSVNSNRGGNTGNVTVLIKGSLFRDSMTATLRGVSQNNTITASKVYFINSATVYATFNLQGAPLGVYDVSLQKPDGSIATLAASFTVEPTNNGGLLTGGGNNGVQKGTGSAPGCDPNVPSGLNTQLQTEVVAPEKAFVGWTFTMQIHYTNTSNVDIPAQVRILYSVDGAPIALTEEGLAVGKTTLYIEFKDAVGPANMIRAGGSGTITVYGKAPANAFAHQFIHFTLQ